MGRKLMIRYKFKFFHSVQLSIACKTKSPHASHGHSTACVHSPPPRTATHCTLDSPHGGNIRRWGLGRACRARPRDPRPERTAERQAVSRPTTHRSRTPFAPFTPSSEIHTSIGAACHSRLGIHRPFKLRALPNAHFAPTPRSRLVQRLAMRLAHSTVRLLHAAPIRKSSGRIPSVPHATAHDHRSHRMAQSQD